MKLKIENDSTSNLMDTQDLSSDVHSANGSAEVTELLRKGIKAAQDGNRADARHLLMQATELEPKNENAWLWLASISEYPEELLIFLNNVLKINSKNERALEWEKSTKSLLSKTFVKRGIEASKESQAAMAKQSFLQAIVHDDKNEMAWLWLASISESVDEKKSHLKKVLKINPENETALTSLETLKHSMAQEQLRQAQVEAIAGEAETAKKLLAEVLKNSPDLENAWLLKCYLNDSFVKKEAYLKNVLEINSENKQAAAGLAALKSLAESTEPKPDSTAVTDFEIEVSEEMFDDIEESNETFEAPPGVAEEIAEDLQPVDGSGESSLVEEAADSPTQEFEVESDSVQELEPVEEPEPAQHIEEIDDEREAEFRYFDDSIDEESIMGSAFQESESDVFEEEAVAETDDADLSVSKMPSYDEVDEVVEEETSSVQDYEANEQSDFEEEEQVFENGVDQETSDAGSDEFESAIQQPEVYFEADPEPEQESLIHDTIADEGAVETILCPFCSSENEPLGFICHACRAMMTMSDVDMMLDYADADLTLVAQKVGHLEAEHRENNLDANGLRTLGIGFLNLKNLRKGFEYLQQAAYLDPNDVVLNSNVNSLAIRLSEIDDQKNQQVSTPKNKTILVVDDSATVRKLVSGKLEKCGLEVVCAVDGMDALEKINESIPDLILLDITMPRMDGYQVCKMIRGNDATKDVPVVMISGKDGFFDKVRGRMAGTTGYITKPFGPETLMKTVEAYID